MTCQKAAEYDLSRFQLITHLLCVSPSIPLHYYEGERRRGHEVREPIRDSRDRG